MTPKDLYGIMHEIAEECEDVDEVTRLWLKAMKPEEMAVLYYPMARREVRNHLRGQARSIEHRYFGPSPDDDLTSLLELRKQLVASTAFVPGIGNVPWGQMTVEQHLSRAEFLRKLASGNIRTAEVHEQTAMDLLAAGVACLDEMAA
jgi:hypothetical protein